MNRLEELKQATTSKSVTLDKYLTAEHPNGKWHIEGNVFIFAYQSPGYAKKTEYRWGLDKQGFYTISGKTSNLTPQFDRKQLAKDKIRSEINPRKLEIHDLVEKLIVELDEDADLLNIVAEKFDITEEQVREIHSEVMLDIQEAMNNA